jgi:hypothetical protein
VLQRVIALGFESKEADKKKKQRVKEKANIKTVTTEGTIFDILHLSMQKQREGRKLKDIGIERRRKKEKKKELLRGNKEDTTK